jgi:hypothetical protein
MPVPGYCTTTVGIGATRICLGGGSSTRRGPGTMMIARGVPSAGGFVGVIVRVGVCVGGFVGVNVGVRVGVAVGVSVGVRVGVSVGMGVGV